MSNSAKQKNLALDLLVLAFAMANEVFLHFNPGAISPDSISILTQARTGIFEDGHPPLMAAIWRLIDHIVPGPVGMLALNLGLFYGGLYLIFYWASERYQYSVWPVFLIVGMFPPLLGILGVIWIDITMAGFFLAALGIFLVGDARPKRSARIFAILVALIFASLGLAIRHNGATAAFPLIVFFLYQCMRTSAKPLVRLVFAMMGGMLVTFLIFLGAKQISTFSVDVQRHLWRVGALYDIVGTSYQEKMYLFYPDVINENSLENINKLYSPRSFTPLVIGEQIHALPGQPMEKGKPFVLNDSDPTLNHRLLLNWMDVIVHHPVAYLTHRYDVFVSLVTRSPWGLWAAFFDRIYPNDLGIAQRPIHDSAYFGFVRSITNRSVIFVPLLYLILSMLAVIPAMVFGLKFQNSPLLAASALYGSGLAHMAGLFFLAASADFRYSHWMIMTATLGTSLVMLEIVRALKNTLFFWMPTLRMETGQKIK